MHQSNEWLVVEWWVYTRLLMFALMTSHRMGMSPQLLLMTAAAVLND